MHSREFLSIREFMTTNKNTFKYRSATLIDKEQLKVLGIISYGQFANILTPENFNELNNNLNNEDKLIELITISTCYVCLDKDLIIGMAYLIPNGNPADIFKAEWSYIRMVGVNPHYQGQGIAKTLTQMCIDKAKQTNEKTIALHTSEFMDAARHIYESLGFKVLQEIEPRLGKKYWLYTLDLN
jgi:ribosomal protein S18 acetylase RimI-like enzyme